MDINDLTIGEAKKLVAFFGGNSSEGHQSPHIGRKCIIRAYASGVHFGELVSQSGRQVELKNARRLWNWDTGGEGISLSEVSQTGIDESKSRVCVTVPEMSILDGLEVIPCSEDSISSIESARVYQP